MFGFGRSPIEKAGLRVADHLADINPAGRRHHASMRNFVSNLCRTDYARTAGRQLMAGGMDAPSVFATLVVIAWMPLKFDPTPRDKYSKELLWVSMMLAKQSAEMYLGDADAAYDEAYQMDTWFSLNGEVVFSAPYKEIFDAYNDLDGRYSHILDIFGFAEASKYIDERGALLPDMDEEASEKAWEIGESKARKLWDDYFSGNN